MLFSFDHVLLEKGADVQVEICLIPAASCHSFYCNARLATSGFGGPGSPMFVPRICSSLEKQRCLPQRSSLENCRQRRKEYQKPLTIRKCMPAVGANDKLAVLRALGGHETTPGPSLPGPCATKDDDSTKILVSFIANILLIGASELWRHD